MQQQLKTNSCIIVKKKALENIIPTDRLILLEPVQLWVLQLVNE